MNYWLLLKSYWFFILFFFCWVFQCLDCLLSLQNLYGPVCVFLAEVFLDGFWGLMASKFQKYKFLTSNFRFFIEFSWLEVKFFPIGHWMDFLDFLMGIFEILIDFSVTSSPNWSKKPSATINNLRKGYQYEIKVNLAKNNRNRKLSKVK